jgi:hypothetical protein
MTKANYIDKLAIDLKPWNKVFRTTGAVTTKYVRPMPIDLKAERLLEQVDRFGYKSTKPYKSAPPLQNKPLEEIKLHEEYERRISDIINKNPERKMWRRDQRPLTEDIDPKPFREAETVSPVRSPSYGDRLFEEPNISFWGRKMPYHGRKKEGSLVKIALKEKSIRELLSLRNLLGLKSEVAYRQVTKAGRMPPPNILRKAVKLEERHDNIKDILEMKYNIARMANSVAPLPWGAN